MIVSKVKGKVVETDAGNIVCPSVAAAREVAVALDPLMTLAEGAAWLTERGIPTTLRALQARVHVSGTLKPDAKTQNVLRFRASTLLRCAAASKRGGFRPRKTEYNQDALRRIIEQYGGDDHVSLADIG